MQQRLKCFATLRFSLLSAALWLCAPQRAIDARSRVSLHEAVAGLPPEETKVYRKAFDACAKLGDWVDFREYSSIIKYLYAYAGQVSEHKQGAKLLTDCVLFLLLYG